MGIVTLCRTASIERHGILEKVLAHVWSGHVTVRPTIRQANESGTHYTAIFTADHHCLQLTVVPDLTDFAKK